MSSLLPAILAFVLLAGSGSTARANIRSDPDSKVLQRQILPARGSILQVLAVYGCKALPDLEVYLTRPSPDEAERFFAEKRNSSLACAVITGVMRVVSYAKRLQAADGSTRCVIEVEFFHAQSNSNMKFFFGWHVFDQKTIIHCTPD